MGNFTVVMTTGSHIGALFTDLYEITMAEAYFAAGMKGTAVFETFFRKLPERRNYAVAAGLDDVLGYLERFRFDKSDLEYLASLEMFSGEFLRTLSDLRFTGDVCAVPEGTIVFPGEPIVRVVAPIVEAQLLETFVLNRVHLHTVLTSKAARVVQAAGERAVIDFGSRRAHGTDAALQVARDSYLAGAAGTSNVLAAMRYGIRPYGTMAHSFIQAFDDEAAAFDAFCRVYPNTTLLVDTYDTLGGVDAVIALSKRLGRDFRVSGIRLDSGDLGELSKQARARLDKAGLSQVGIFASSDLDEWKVAELVRANCPIDAFGVGTRMAVSRDSPALDMAYKLVEYDGTARGKLSKGKVFYPGRKQIFRQMERGTWTGDVLAEPDEEVAGEPLLLPVMEHGERCEDLDSGLDAARRRLRRGLQALPPELLSLESAASSYPVSPSPRVAHSLELLRRRLGRGVSHGPPR